MVERFIPQIHEVSPGSLYSLIQNIWSSLLPRLVTADGQVAGPGFWGDMLAPLLGPIRTFHPVSSPYLWWPLCLDPWSLLPASNFNISSSLHWRNSGIPEHRADHLPSCLTASICITTPCQAGSIWGIEAQRLPFSLAREAWPAWMDSGPTYPCEYIKSTLFSFFQI